MQRGIFYMGKQKKYKNRLMKKWNDFFNAHQFFCSILASILASGIVVAISVPNRFTRMEDDVAELIVNVNKLNENIGKINLDSEFEQIGLHFDSMERSFEDIYNNIEKVENRIERMENRIERIEDKVFEVAILLASDTSASAINTLYDSVRTENFKVETVFSKSDVIGTVMGTDIKYMSEQLVNQKILLTYLDNGDEVFFSGQFNENNHWDGKCVINVYNNGELKIITEAEYDDGEMINYEQVLLDEEADGKRWFISERKNEGDFNSGKTWQFDYGNGYKKPFAGRNATSEDIINVKEFKGFINTGLKSFYFGHTSDGQYNDELGESYYVSFTSDGFVKTLYVGDFKDGKFNDDSGEAWEIVFDTSNDINRYFYYKGNFKNGIRDSEPEKYISRAEINDIISAIQMEFELRWYENEEYGI